MTGFIAWGCCSDRKAEGDRFFPTCKLLELVNVRWSRQLPKTQAGFRGACRGSGCGMMVQNEDVHMPCGQLTARI